MMSDGNKNLRLKILWTCGVVVLVAAALAVAILFFTGVSYRSPSVIELSRLHELGILLREYSDSHNGKFPEKPSDIPEAAIESAPGDYSKRDLLHYYDPETQKPYEWLYFRDDKGKQEPTRILAASPRAIEGPHNLCIVLYANGVTLMKPEPEFREELKEQLETK